MQSMFFLALSLLGSSLVSGLGSRYDLIPPLQLDAQMNYDFKGSTMVSRNYVKLTSNEPDQRGYIVSNAPGPLPENMEVTMEFSIGGGGRNMYGDGMVLWLIENEPMPGTMFGMNEYYKGLALAIDTYRNGRGGRVFPRLVIMKNDGETPYDKDNDGDANEIGGCSLRGLHDNRRQDYSKLRISYSRPQRMLTIEIDFRSGWELCDFMEIDLGNVNRLAVSAATGELVERHIVKELKVEDYGLETPPVAAAKLAERKSRQSSREQARQAIGDEYEPSRFMSLIYLAGRTLWLIIKIAAGLAVVWQVLKYIKRYRQRKEDDKYKLI